MNSPIRILLPLIVIIASLFVLYPNFAERELELSLKPDFTQLPATDQEKILGHFKTRWQEEYNKEGEWKIQPDVTSLVATSLPEKIQIQGHYITSAKINQISQENSELFLESRNKLKSLWIEDLIKKGKPLTVKLGLDLQGGMRVVLKGDFETYSTKLRDIYLPESNSLQEKINNPATSEADKSSAKNRLEEIESNFELNPTRKLIELEKAKLIIDNRLTNQNLTEPQVRIQKDQDSIEVSLPGLSNSSQILEILQNTETVEYRLEEPAPRTYISMIQASDNEKMRQTGNRESTDIVKFQKIVTDKLGKKAEEDFLRSLESQYKIPTDRYKLFAYWARGNKPGSPLLPREFIVLERSIALSGNDLTNATPSFDNNNMGWAVSFALTPAGAEKFFQVTSENTGRNLAIIWGDKVISNPTIRGAIAGGRAEITGSFTQDEAVRLSNVISEGALPIPLSVLEMRFIGPTLGIESIEVGIRSVILGFLFTIVYMIFYYRLAGIVADFALLVNLIILTALLSLMDYTLTLPGFAGIILTVGMAVDANVIIYERIREELAHGRSLQLSITRGFENAFWTIMDSNITTLIAGILMIRLGNGPIKGFAITLCWGIVTSLFTSLFMSRVIMELLVDKGGLRKLSLGFGKPYLMEKSK